MPLASNEFYKERLTKLGMPADERKFFLAGLGAGLTEGFVNCPFELVKVRMQQKGSVLLPFLPFLLFPLPFSIRSFLPSDFPFSLRENAI